MCGKGAEETSGSINWRLYANFLNFLRLGIPCQAGCVTLVCGWRSQHSVRALWQVMQIYFGGRQLSQLVEDEGLDGGQGGQGDCLEASLLSFGFNSGGGQGGWLNFEMSWIKGVLEL